MSKLLVVGTVAFDAIETPFGKTDKILGGSGTFVGLAAAHFGVQTGIVSVVGGDFPQSYLSMMNDKGINTDGVEVIQDGKTFFWSGKYHNDMNSRDTLITELNVLADFTPVVPETFRDAAIVVLGNLHPLTQSSVLDQLSAQPKLVILDTMNFWMDAALEDLHRVLKRVDVITINDEEARQLSGEYSLVNAAKKIHLMGPKFVVIKKALQALPSSDSAVVNTPAENGMESFARLQVRLMLATVIVSAVATLFATFYFDLFVARSLLVGAVAGLFYLRLLARSVARLGGGSRQVGRFQLVVPIVLIVAAARLPQLDLLPAFVGFLLYKPALILQTVFDG